MKIAQLFMTNNAETRSVSWKQKINVKKDVGQQHPKKNKAERNKNKGSGTDRKQRSTNSRQRRKKNSGIL